MKNDAKMDETNRPKTLKFGDPYNRFEGFGVLQIHRKMMPKWSPKIDYTNKQA